MKKKILIASILLAITAIVLVGYFGCGQQESGTVSTRTAVDESSKEEDITFVEVADKLDSDIQVPTEPQTVVQLQQETEKEEVQLRTQLEPAKESEETAPAATKSEKYGMLRPEDSTDLRNQQEI